MQTYTQCVSNIHIALWSWQRLCTPKNKIGLHSLAPTSSCTPRHPRRSSPLVQHCPANGAATSLHPLKHTPLSFQWHGHHPPPLAHTHLCLQIYTRIASFQRKAHHAALFYNPITLCPMMHAAHDILVSLSHPAPLSPHTPHLLPETHRSALSVHVSQMLALHLILCTPNTYIALLPTTYGTSWVQQTHRSFCTSWQTLFSTRQCIVSVLPNRGIILISDEWTQHSATSLHRIAPHHPTHTSLSTSWHTPQ